MKRVVLLGGTGLGTVGAGLLAAGYGAAGALLCVVAVACFAVAFSVTWRLEEAEEPEASLRRTEDLPRV